MSSVAAQAITSGLSKLNPFGKISDEDENKGEATQADSVGGGGLAARKSKITRDQLRVSHALELFLIQHGLLSKEDVWARPDDFAPALKALLEKPHIRIPSSVTDRSYPISEYLSLHPTTLTC